jgi:hypothetical protein
MSDRRMNGSTSFSNTINRKLDILLNEDDCYVWLVVSNKNFLLQ